MHPNAPPYTKVGSLEDVHKPQEHAVWRIAVLQNEQGSSFWLRGFRKARYRTFTVNEFLQISQLPFYLLSWLSYQDGIQIANTYTLSIWIGIFYKYESMTHLIIHLPNSGIPSDLCHLLSITLNFAFVKKIPVLHYQQIFICLSCKTGILRKIWMEIWLL